MLTPSVIARVKATAPVLSEHGYTRIHRFYERLFQAHPGGEQQRALARAGLAYVTHIDDLPSLSSAVQRITQKHV